MEERRSARLALTTEISQLEQVWINSRLGMALGDGEGRWLRVNPALCAMLGYSEDELVGHASTEFTHPDDQELTRNGLAEMQARLTGTELEKRLIRRDGTVIWVELTISVWHDATANENYFIGQLQDITERKRTQLALAESEERLRALLSQLQEIVMLVDAGGLVAYATPSIERWLGYSPDELTGTELRALIHADDVDAVLGAVESLRPGAPASLRHRVLHKDGSWHTLESKLVCMLDDPSVEAVLFASTDATDRIALEQARERLELERRVSHRLEAVGQLAAGIAHEINTPLQFVGDSVSFLKEAVTELLVLTGRYREMLWGSSPLELEQRRSIMAQAEQQADVDYLMERIPAAFARTADGVARVRSIVQAMKRFSHPSSGEVALENLNESLETTLAVCRNEYKYVAEVELELGELPLVPCNVGEINQVFLNLIVNAAQAIEGQRANGAGGTEAPMGRIKISTRVEADQAVVVIADDGPGIPEHLQERIYEPFFTTKEVGKGTGQGLALARAIVHNHGGTLQCRSRPGHGASFTVRLPLAPATVPEEASADVGPASDPVTGAPGTALR